MGVFTELAERPSTPAELAQKLNSHERGTESLLLALVAIGYVIERDGRYANSAMTEKWVLSPDSFNLGAALTFWTAVFQELSSHWLEVMQTGERPYGHIYQWLEEKPDIANAFQRQLMASVAFTGPDVVKKLNLPETAEWILDVGGGHGLFSIMFCEQHPQLQATIIDTPAALQTAKTNTAQHGLTERVHLYSADLWEAEWGDGYDAILLFNLIHHFDPAQNVELLRRCAAALKPGGQLEMNMTKKFERWQHDSWLEAEAAPLEWLAWVIPLATAVATTANIMLYYIITGWLGNDLIVGGAETELWLLPVEDIVIFSIVFSLAAGFVFVVAAQVAQRPIRTYLIIATIALLLSFYPPLSFPSPRTEMVDKLSLVAMHVVGAIAVVGVLVGLGRKS